jgi:dihydrofolate reductase
VAAGSVCIHQLRRLHPHQPGWVHRAQQRRHRLVRANAALPAGEDCGYADFMRTVDAIVMGRAIFDTVFSFPEWPYGDLPVHVLSRTLGGRPAGVPDSVQVLCATPHEVVERAAAAGHRHLYIDGGRTIQGFLKAGLITELTITVIPILLGSGLRLFDDGQADTNLRLLSSKAYPFGFVQSHYAVCRES